MSKLHPHQATAMLNYKIAQLNEIPPVPCPCGFSRRAFVSPESAASLHLVEIQKDSRTHYHKRMTEIYLVLEGEGQMELDGQLISVKPMTLGPGLEGPPARYRYRASRSA